MNHKYENKELTDIKSVENDILRSKTFESIKKKQNKKSFKNWDAEAENGSFEI